MEMAAALPRAPVEGQPDIEWSRRAAATGAIAVIVLAALALSWAKWLPYLRRAGSIAASGRYPTPPTHLGASAGAGLSSPVAAWHFTTTYLLAVWPALLAALAIGAALTALLPARRRVVAGGGRGFWSVLGATALSLPTMMCTCCTAPVAVAMRRRGAGPGQVTAFWLGNPLLNPAVLVFLALLLPWRFVALRAAAGVALVVGLAWVTARWGGKEPARGTVLPDAQAQPTVRIATRRFAVSAGRLALLLVPEYVAVVFLVGLVAGVVPAAAHAGSSPVVLALLAVAATLTVIPTGGEIPLVMGALAAGVGSGVAAVLLIALPALSIPSMLMMRRALLARSLVVLAASVAAAAFVAGLVAALV